MRPPAPAEPVVPCCALRSRWAVQLATASVNTALSWISSRSQTPPPAVSYLSGDSEIRASAAADGAACGEPERLDPVVVPALGGTTGDGGPGERRPVQGAPRPVAGFWTRTARVEASDSWTHPPAVVVRGVNRSTLTPARASRTLTPSTSESPSRRRSGWPASPTENPRLAQGFSGAAVAEGQRSCRRRVNADAWAQLCSES
jgi:hypothetical protein